MFFGTMVEEPKHGDYCFRDMVFAWSATAFKRDGAQGYANEVVEAFAQNQDILTRFFWHTQQIQNAKQTRWVKKWS